MSLLFESIPYFIADMAEESAASSEPHGTQQGGRRRSLLALAPASQHFREGGVERSRSPIPVEGSPRVPGPAPPGTSAPMLLDSGEQVRDLHDLIQKAVDIELGKSRTPFLASTMKKPV